MSQISFLDDTGGVGGDVVSLSGDVGGKVSSDVTGNILLTAAPGIYTLSQPGSNSIKIGRTEFIVGAVHTTDDTPTNAISFDMGTFPGVYTLKGTISAFNVTDSTGAGFFFSGSFRTDGAIGTELGVDYGNSYSEALMNGVSFTLGVVGNDISIDVTGLLLKTIHWSAEFDYVLAL